MTSRYGHGSDGRAEPWAGLCQLLLVRITREFIDHGEKPPVIEDHHYLTSLSPKDKMFCPEVLLGLVRGHWGIENGLHHKKDRTMREDEQRRKLGARMMSWLRSLSIGLHSFIDGETTAEKEITIRSNYPKALKIMKRQRFPKNGMVLL